VSPRDAPDEVYLPNGPTADEKGAFLSLEPFESSSDGEAVAYAGDPLDVGGTGIRGDGQGNAFLADRTESGWATADVQPAGRGESTSEAQLTAFQAFLFPSSVGIFAASSTGLAGSAEPEGPVCQEGTHALYARSGDGVHHSLFSKLQTTELCGQPLLAGATLGTGETFFQTEAALTEAAIEDAPGSGTPCPSDCNLYDAADGHITLVNVLPDGTPAPHATFGAPRLTEGLEENNEEPNFSGAISSNGSRAYWTDEETSRVYMRRNPSQDEDCAIAADACTVAVSGPGSARYWGTSSDGQSAYYSEGGALLRFDADAGEGSNTQELVPSSADIQGVVAISEDGGYVYFVASRAVPGTGAASHVCSAANASAEAGHYEEETGEPFPIEKLAQLQGEEAEEAEGKLPSGRGCNLYVFHAGTTRLIVTLSPQDNQQLKAGAFGRLIGGDWRPALGHRTAQATPGGVTLAFQSALSLTGYSTSALSGGAAAHIEIFAYEANTGTLLCASCSPSGSSPAEVQTPLTYLPISGAATYMRRWLSADGSRIIFSTSQPLVPSDHNATQDVYEWERAGSGSCTAGSGTSGNGCVFLLSAGLGAGATSTGAASETETDAHFVDSSASGRDIFLVTRAPVLPGLQYDTYKLYDVREDGGFGTNDEGAACSGEACRGSASNPASVQIPGSSIFSGPGNFSPPAPVTIRPARRKSTAELLASALRACRRKHNRAKRASCEAKARKRYKTARKPVSKRRANHSAGARGKS
jgi:hypothetical protein